MVVEVDAPNLSSIIFKLGHDLEVIRERALKSILFKLEHSIINLEQLCIEPNLCTNLLTWFNKDVVKDEELVLDLLFAISKHPISGNRLISIGALPFLESLRENSPSSFFSLIDKVISSLSSVPPLPPHFDFHELNQHISSDNNNNNSDTNSVSSSISSYSQGNSSVSEQLKRQAKLLLDVDDNVDLYLNSNDTEFTFPPIPICREDDQFLKEISVKIQMADSKIVGLCLTQIRDEILQDFPPEILLQKTDIFKGLLMQLKPSPIDQQLLTVLHDWVTLLKSSLRLSLDHSFSSSPSSENPLPSSETSVDSPAQTQTQTQSHAFDAQAHETQRGIAPAHAAHHILVKALGLAHHFTILGEVVWLCKSLIPLVKPRDFGLKDVARFKEYMQVMEKTILQYKDKITQEPLCTSYLSIVLLLLKSWSITDITSIVPLSLSKLLAEIFGDDTLYVIYPNFREEFRPLIAVLEYPQDPYRGGSLSPIATIDSHSFLPSPSSSSFLSSHIQHLFESLRRATSPSELVHTLSMIRSFCLSDSFHLHCVWEIQWEPYLKRFLAPQAAPESEHILKPLVEFLELMALSRTSLPSSVISPNLNFLVRCALETLAPLLLNESKRRTYILRKCVLSFLKSLLENPSISHSLHSSFSSLSSLTPILLSLACTTSVETPTVANLTTFSSLDSSDASQARLSLGCLAALASAKNEQVWKTYSWDYIVWTVRIFASKRTGSSFRGKSILRASLLCLRNSGYKIDWTISSPLDPARNSPQVEKNPRFVDDIAEWCFSLLGEREAAIRGLSCSVLACIAAHPLSSSISPLLVHSSDAIARILDIACDDSECYEVRSEAFHFLSNLATNFLSHNPSDNMNGEDINEKIGHRRIITTLQQAKFFSHLGSFLVDSQAAPKFLHSVAHLIWVLLCLDNVEVPRILMAEGIYTLLIELLCIEAYWKRYTKSWSSFWETQDSLSLVPPHIPEWAKHQWQAINEVYISSTCKEVFESLRVVIYDDVNMRNYFLKDTRLASYCLDVLLTDKQEFLGTKISALLLLNNLAFQASEAERNHLISATPSNMQISIWQVLAFNLDVHKDEPVRESVCQVLAALLDNSSSNNDNNKIKALEATAIDRVAPKLSIQQDNPTSIIYANSTCVGTVLGKNLVEMYRRSSSQHQSLSTAPCFYALQNILAFSSSAKQIAIHLNLLQDLRIAMEQRINLLFSLSNPSTSEEASIEDKISESVLDLLLHVPILRNLLHESDAARQAAYHEDFNEIFYSIVYYITHTLEKQALRLQSFNSSSPSFSSLLQLQTTLLSESLSLLQVYTHHQSDTFKTSLLLHQYNGVSKKMSLKESALVAPSQKSGIEKSCILTMLCDFTLKPKMEGNDEVFNHIATCLGDSSDSSSVRGFVLKSSVFQRCVDIIHKQASNVKQTQPPKLHTALQFFISLSFESSAQVYLMKIKGLLEYLFDLLECKDESVRSKCMFLLRNLSYSNENKPFFLSNDRGLRLITNSLVYPNVKLQCFSTNLLWSLLYSNQKASVKLKKVKGLVENLQQLLSGTKKGSEDKVEPHRNKFLLQIQENVETIFKLLGLD